MALPPLPTAPYPSIAASQAAWSASMLQAQEAQINYLASQAAAAYTWIAQRQWALDGGGMATYPLPLASGPLPALPIRMPSAAGGSLPLALSITPTP